MPAKKNVEKSSVSQQEPPISPVGLHKTRNSNTCTESLIQQLLQIIEASVGNKGSTNKAPVSNEEELILALTSCVANALHNNNSIPTPDEVPRTYWVDLGQQIEVDRWVDFARYCAANGFRPLKAKYIMECLLSFKQLVEKEKLHHEEAIVTGKEDLATEEQYSQTLSSVSHTLSSLQNRFDLPELPTKDDEMISTAAEMGSLTTPFWIQVQQQLKDFVIKEIDLGCKWERIHHSADMFSGVSAPGAGPMLNVSTLRFDDDSGFGPEKPPAAATLVKRKGKGEKTSRQQQLLQQQQEQLEEEKRQIVATMSASMPSENIHLTPVEIPDFLNYLYKGLLQHAALYQYLSQYPQAEEKSVEELQAGSNNCFLLPLEEPMSIPPLNLSNEMLSTYSATVEPVPSIPIKTGRTNTIVTTPIINAAAPAAEVAVTLPSSSGKGLEGESRERVSESPLSVLQTLQKQEINKLGVKYQEEIASEERLARAEQIEKEMTLFFETHGTQKAVDDIYMSIDHELRQKQWHILQRVKALEVALGIN
ncbi:unnamed protein product [Phytomonas sp. Hart1]|nr:unnamed protein product [Phytomonas sp. Hart1]|eukprot:CCW71240.1 unnamed protein product [Phytomonas sp. isolate Hart1]